MVHSGFPHGDNTGISKIYDTDTGHGQFNVECPAKRLCPDLEKYYQTFFRTRASEACDSFVKIFRQLAPRYDCQRSVDHTPTKDYTVPAVYLCKEILAAEQGAPGIYEYIKLLRKLRSNDARSFFASAYFRSFLDGELRVVRCPDPRIASLGIRPSVTSESEPVRNMRCRPAFCWQHLSIICSKALFPASYACASTRAESGNHR